MLPRVTSRIGFAVTVAALAAACSAGTPGHDDFGLRELQSSLRGRSLSTRLVRAADDVSFPRYRSYRLCAEHREVQVFEYRTVDARRAVSQTIGRTGSPVAGAYIEWAGPPRFFARGRLLLLYVGNSSRLRRTLTSIAGSTLTPRAAKWEHSLAWSPAAKQVDARCA